MHIPFNKPHVTGRELGYLSEAVHSNHLSGDGDFSRRCHRWLEERIGCRKALLTHSCTAALEMAAMLAQIGPGDEVIMPSYTFVSTANAFVLRGANIVFVDIRPDTCNIDEAAIEAAITPRSRAIVVVHYAGVSCEMDAILEIARRHGLLVIEDAAQGIEARYKGRPLGSLGDLAALSFHETKNVIAGEGGALLINNEAFVERAEILWEKGTNRRKFFRGQVDKYTWVDIGSSFLPSELTAAFLWAQLEASAATTNARLAVWNGYQAALGPRLAARNLAGPTIPPDCDHNAHMYYVRTRDLESRGRLLKSLNESGVNAVFHYVPLHDSPAGRRYGRCAGSMAVTRQVSDSLIRLPLWPGMSEAEIALVTGKVLS
ncbi:MAG TPA: dTDP-4-amino-4,6-dideoxygalactose transaminase [Burkholderiales bacterium]|nr:dTDP-4-amino-4,6-dideoxygalactose transaminase [Burkholderiales bacterium]